MRFFFIVPNRWWLFFVFFLTCTSGQFQEGVFTNKDVSYRLGVYSSSWQVEQRKGVNVFLKHVDNEGIIVANSRCGKSVDEKNEVLIADLFLEVTRTPEISRSEVLIDGISALRMKHNIEQKIAQTQSDSVLLKKGNCAFWLQLVAKPKSFEALDRDFETFFKGFSYIQGK